MDSDYRFMDKIYIRGLCVNCIIGTNPEERVKKQDILVDLTLYTDLSHAGKTDDLNDTINYREIKERVEEMIVGSSFFLLERLADAIAEICLSTEDVAAVKILIEKPGALPGTRCAGVEIFRRAEKADCRKKV